MGNRYLFKAKGENTGKWYIGILTRVDEDKWKFDLGE